MENSTTLEGCDYPGLRGFSTILIPEASRSRSAIDFGQDSVFRLIEAISPRTWMQDRLQPAALVASAVSGVQLADRRADGRTRENDE